MRLTEAKLKQMILEALKDSSFRSFGEPTPDEKLRADLGDEMYGKIQSLDKNQADIMKQSFEPNYPREIKQENINDVLEPFGFAEYKPGYFNRDDSVYKIFNLGNIGSDRAEVIFSFFVSNSVTSKDFEEFKRYPKSIGYLIKINKFDASKPGQSVGKEVLLRKREYIKTPKMFAVDLTDEQEREQIESLIIKKEKVAILKALEELT